MIGAMVPGRMEAARCLEFCQRKQIFPKVNTRKFKLEDINEMIELMENGKVQDGRMVIHFC
jgi:Zn-dependent alcohol dehydrogenases